MAVEAQLFKQTLAQWASGVTVVTTIYEGKWKGTTVSSFCSVSLNPPLVLICLDKSLYTHELLTKAGVFAVNILSTDQLEVGKLFAGMYPEVDNRFAEINTETAYTGSPVFSDSPGWVDCEIRHMYEAGDHTMFVGEVMAAHTKEETTDPIMYFNRRWGRFAGLGER